ncbi:MAG: hypothetical protein FJY29_04580 [Betaproteobacteria bacterium]|nr:hypothetical protein [Betaproteobacteria bacterium]
MGEVLSFSRKKSPSSEKSRAAPSKSKAPKTEAKNAKPSMTSERPELKPRALKKKETMSSESIKVWWISQEFDDLIRKAVLDKHIPVEELAAVMAHRLGTLLMSSERTPELTLFCMKVISKITNQPHPGSNAS